MFHRTTFLVLAGILAGSAGTAAGQTPAPRGKAPSNLVLAHVDVETTGLEAGYHEMVDIGVVYTDREGNTLKKWYRKLMPEHLDRVTEGAVAINGFDPAIWRKQGAVSPKQALDEMLALEKEHFAGRPILRVAYNCSFDSGFLAHWFRAHGIDWRKLYHYGFFDIPSMAWALGYRELFSFDLAKAVGVEDEPHTPLEHTGLTGAELNVRLYRALLAVQRRGK